MQRVCLIGFNNGNFYYPICLFCLIHWLTDWTLLFHCSHDLCIWTWVTGDEHKVSTIQGIKSKRDYTYQKQVSKRSAQQLPWMPWIVLTWCLKVGAYDW
jgi:hypothetical protein